jgi:hypothetical protein
MAIAVRENQNQEEVYSESRIRTRLSLDKLFRIRYSLCVITMRGQSVGLVPQQCLSFYWLFSYHRRYVHRQIKRFSLGGARIVGSLEVHRYLSFFHPAQANCSVSRNTHPMCKTCIHYGYFTHHFINRFNVTYR